MYIITQPISRPLNGSSWVLYVCVCVWMYECMTCSADNRHPLALAYMRKSSHFHLIPDKERPEPSKTMYHREVVLANTHSHHQTASNNTTVPFPVFVSRRAQKEPPCAWISRGFWVFGWAGPWPTESHSQTSTSLLKESAVKMDLYHTTRKNNMILATTIVTSPPLPHSWHATSMTTNALWCLSIAHLSDKGMPEAYTVYSLTRTDFQLM